MQNEQNQTNWISVGEKIINLNAITHAVGDLDRLEVYFQTGKKLKLRDDEASLVLIWLLDNSVDLSALKAKQTAVLRAVEASTAKTG